MDFFAVRYSMTEGITFMPSSASTNTSTRNHEQPHEADAILLFAHLVSLPLHRNPPKRPSSLKFSQIKNALPTMFSSGTNPQYRLSLLLSRLSPIMK